MLNEIDEEVVVEDGGDLRKALEGEGIVVEVVIEGGMAYV